jgi:hypothetical protein
MGMSRSGLVLIHNHPAGTSFSAADLLVLVEPGVEGTVIVGADGSAYAATAGPNYTRTQATSRSCVLVNPDVHT